MTGAEQGHPVRFLPKFVPPSGSPIGIELHWTEEGKPRRADAREWIKDERADTILTTDWVFAGSEFYVDEITKKKLYAADDGDLITVANFASSILDLPFASTANDAGRTFVANTARIPPRGTPVTLFLRPRPALAPPEPSRTAMRERRTLPPPTIRAHAPGRRVRGPLGQGGSEVGEIRHPCALPMGRTHPVQLDRQSRDILPVSPSQPGEKPPTSRADLLDPRPDRRFSRGLPRPGSWGGASVDRRIPRSPATCTASRVARIHRRIRAGRIEAEKLTLFCSIGKIAAITRHREPH